MSKNTLQSACDQFSSIVDDVQFERFRWSRDEAPKLARLVELVKAAFDGREDFELAEEGATADFKRYLIKVHSQRTIAIAVMLQGGQAVIGAEPVERSHFTIPEGPPFAVDFDKVDEKWIGETISSIVSKVQAVKVEIEAKPETEPEPEVQSEGSSENEVSEESRKPLQTLRA